MRALALILALWSGAALAQPVQQSGAVTPGHPVQWTTNGVVQDGGSPAQGRLTGLGVTAPGPGICQNSGPVTGAFNRICLGATASGGTLSLDGFNGATGGLEIVVNGVPIGGGGVSSVTGTSGEIAASPTSGDVVLSLPSTITPDLTFSGDLTLSGGVALSGLSTGTQVSCLGLDSGNNVVLSSGACGSGGGGAVSSVGNASADTTLTIAGTGSGPWTGDVTLKVNQATNWTWTGTHLFEAAAASVSGNGQATLGADSTAGGVLNAEGSSKDWTIEGAGTTDCTIAHGATILVCGGFATAATGTGYQHATTTNGIATDLFENLSTGTSAAVQLKLENSNGLLGAITLYGAFYTTTALQNVLAINGLTELLLQGGSNNAVLIDSSGNPTLYNIVTLAGVTGSTQCLHVSSAGAISGTGSDCGSVTITAGTTATSGFTANHLISSNGSNVTADSGIAASSGNITTGAWQGTKIGLAYGGTNADLSATGGTSQVLKQTSAGGTITVGQLAASDITYTNPATGGAAITQSSYNQERVSIIDFGAVPDATTGHATANYNAFVNALATGKQVFVPYASAGYNIGTNVIAMTDGQSVVCENNTVILGQGTSILSLTGTSQWKAEHGCTFNMNGASSGSQAILINDASAIVNYAWITDTTCLHAYACISTNGGHGVDYMTWERIYSRNSLGLQFSITDAHLGGNLIMNTLNCDFTGVSGNVSWGCGYFNDFAGLSMLGLNTATGTGTGTPSYNSGVVAWEFVGEAMWLDRVDADTTIGDGILISGATYIWSNYLEGGNNCGTPITIASSSDGNLTNVISYGGALLSVCGAASKNDLNISSSNNLNIANFIGRDGTGDAINISGTSAGNTITNSVLSSNTGYAVTIAGTAANNSVNYGTAASNTAGTTNITSSGAKNSVAWINGITTTIGVGGTSNIAIGAQSSYNVISLNNSTTYGASTYALGIFGGASGDANTLYFSAPGAFNWFLSGSSVLIATASLFEPSTDNAVTLGASADRWSTVYAYNVNAKNHYGSSGSSPSVSACGTSPSITGTDVAGKVTVGSGVVSSCTVSFAASYATAPACTVASGTAIASLTVTTSTSGIVIGGTSLTSDVIIFNCMGTS